MPVNVIYSKTGLLYKDIYRIHREIINNPVFSRYDLVFFSIPSDYRPDAVKHYLDELFFHGFYVGFYSIYSASNAHFSDKAIAAMFIANYQRETISKSHRIFNNLTDLHDYLRFFENDRRTTHFMFVPYPLKNFRERFADIEEVLKGLKTPVVGLFTGGLDYTREYPVIIPDGFVRDGEVLVVSLKNVVECSSSVSKYTTIGPPFEFTAKGFVMETIDGESAASFIRKVLKKKETNIGADVLTGFPVLIETENGERILRFPKELIGDKLLFWSPLPPKGKFRFVYIEGCEKELLHQLLKECEKFYPCEAGLFFNCVGKSAYFDPHREWSLIRHNFQYPFLMVGSYGEILNKDGNFRIINGSLTFSLIKDGVENNAKT